MSRSIDFTAMARDYRRLALTDSDPAASFVSRLYTLADALTVADQLINDAYRGRSKDIIDAATGDFDFADASRKLIERADAWQAEIDAQVAA